MRTLLLLTGIVAGLLLGGETSYGGLPKSHPYVKRANVKLNNVKITKGKVTSGKTINSANTQFTVWTVPEICQAYNFPTKIVAANGVIGILEFGGGWYQSDLDLFSSLMGMPKITVQNVSIDGTTNSPGVDPNADIEVALDIQAAAAAYYYASGKMPTIIVFFSNGDYIKTFQAAVKAQCDVLSISWGLNEYSTQVNTPGYAVQIEAAAQAATAAGLTIFAAAGDNSSGDGITGNNGGINQNNVDLPASCPHIIGCGGTSKDQFSEEVWGDGLDTDPGTGGGYSSIFPIQSFQIGAPKAPAGTGRMIPDISANADPNTGVIIVQGGFENLVGGTSGVSPLYSGLFAAIGKKLGYITPTLWKNPNAFVDITVGSNGGYSATSGPDACTGLGVPNGVALMAAFAPQPPPPPPVNTIAVNYNTITQTLTLNGDTNNNSLTITKTGTSLLFQPSNGTSVTMSTNNGAAGPLVTYAAITGFSGNLTVVGNLSDGNDSISLVGLPITKITLGLGAGNDSASLSLCTVTTCAMDGGTGTDTFASPGSKITTNQNTNFP